MSSPAHPLAHVVLLGPGESPRVISLESAIVTVGSGPSCDLRVADPDVEAVHLELRRDGARYSVVRRGMVLRVNGQRVREQELSGNDLVVIGRTALAFRWGAPPAAAESDVDVAFSVRVFERLSALAGRLRSGDAPAAVRRQLVSDVLALTGADVACCAWLDEAGTPFLVEASPEDVGEGELVLSRTVISRVLDTRRPIVWRDVAGADAFDLAQSLKAAQVTSVVAAPLFRGERLTAVLYASSKRDAAFGGQTVDVVVLFARLGEQLLEDAAERRGLEERATRASEELDRLRQHALVGVSPAMRQLEADLRKVARSELAVLVLGETGTGKELVARQIHEGSARRDGPFVAVNCGAIPSELVEATLFGHTRGAFTGAHAPSIGLVQAANGGTLFLDEVAELPLDKQSKLLRVLETHEVLPIGATAPLRVDFRLVSATLRPLDDARGGGILREDLFFRIAGVVLRLPPLRERGEDVLLIAEHFLRQKRIELGRHGLRFSSAARTALRAYGWPGNVRELATAIARASTLAESDVLEPADFDLPGAEAASAIVPLAEARDAFQKRYVVEVVERFGGNRTLAAAALGVTPRTIYKYLDEM